MALLIVFLGQRAFAQGKPDEARPQQDAPSRRVESELGDREPITHEIFGNPESGQLVEDVEGELPGNGDQASDSAVPDEIEDSEAHAPLVPKQRSSSGGFGGMFGGSPPGYTASWLPNQAVINQPGELGVLRQSLSLGAPLSRNESGMLISSIQLSDSRFFTDAVLPDSMRPFPTDLANIGLGLSYMHRFANGWSAVAISKFGSASDKPFHALRDMNYMTGGFLQIPARNGRDSWTLGTIYSPVGMLNFPIPLVAYSWRPTYSFHMNIGLPLSVEWTPWDALSINVTYVPLTNIQAVTSYQLTKRASLYGGYRFFNEAYFLADRQIDQDRFFSIEQHLFCGVKIHIWRNAYGDLAAGYAFDRRYGEGRNQTAALHDKLSIEPAAYLSIGLGWQF